MIRSLAILRQRIPIWGIQNVRTLTFNYPQSRYQINKNISAAVPASININQIRFKYNRVRKEAEEDEVIF